MADEPKTVQLPNGMVVERTTVHALRAVVRGEATADQQQRAMEWVIKEACQFYEPSFSPETPNTDLACHQEGRRYVGWLIVNISNMQLIRRKEERSEQGN